MLFSFIHGEHEGVDRLLVNITTPFVVEDKSLGSGVLDLSSILDARQFTYRLIDVSFVENSVGFPENEDGICTFFKLLLFKRNIDGVNTSIQKLGQGQT